MMLSTTSDTSARLPSGTRLVRSCKNVSRSDLPSTLAISASTVRCIAVSIIPGATLLTLMPWRASATDAVLLNESTAALLAA